MERKASPGNFAQDDWRLKMFGVFYTKYSGEVIWLATLHTEEQAVETANETMLQSEQNVMVIPLIHFREG